MIVSFFGHRNFPKSIEYRKKLLDILEYTVGNSEADFYLGNYGNFDRLAVECCKKYQELHPNVSLVFITPYITPGYQNRLAEMNKIYDAIIYPEIEDKPLRFAIPYRNKWMVEK